MNVGQLVARIAVDAAVEDVEDVVFARYNGNGCTTNTDNQSPSATDVVIHGSSFDGRAGEMPPVLAHRVSNRRLYGGELNRFVATRRIRALSIDDRLYIFRVLAAVAFGVFISLAFGALTIFAFQSPRPGAFAQRPAPPAGC